jgi:hypothetical protein
VIRYLTIKNLDFTKSFLRKKVGGKQPYWWIGSLFSDIPI